MPLGRVERHRFTFCYILYIGFLHLYNSDVPCILTQRQADLRHPPHAHAAIFHPADMVHVGPGRCWDCQDRSEVAEGDCIAPTVWIQGWLVSWTRRQFSITAVEDWRRPESGSGQHTGILSISNQYGIAR